MKYEIASAGIASSSRKKTVSRLCSIGGATSRSTEYPGRPSNDGYGSAASSM